MGNEALWHRRIKLLMQVLVSLAVLGGALFIVLSNQYPDSYTKWAFGAIGLVIGYWLK